MTTMSHPPTSRDEMKPVLVQSAWAPAPKRPRVVCLCGSTKFKDHFIMANYELTKAGVIVLTVGWFSHDPGTKAPTQQEKADLDQLHLRKIDLADEVIVLDVGGYVGTSTKREIQYALDRGIPVYSYTASVELVETRKIPSPLTLSPLTTQDHGKTTSDR